MATIDSIPTWTYWSCVVDDATGIDARGRSHGHPGSEVAGRLQLSEIAAETRAGKTTMIAGEIETGCGYRPEMWETLRPSKP